MKRIVMACIAITACTVCFAQKPTDLDKSPMDMSYWPNNYPLLKMSGKAKDMPVARVVYSRPLKNDRDIFGGIIKYKDMWRLGANEATEIEFFKNVKVGNTIIAKGRYTMYCIPDESKWTIIINSDNYSWGSFTYDTKKDIVRVDVPVQKNDEMVEAFTIYFDETSFGSNLIMLWDNVKAILPVNNSASGANSPAALPQKKTSSSTRSKS
jgi:hypothetical protein